MGERLAGKVALITGGSRGIGRAIAELFASEAAEIIIMARSDNPGYAVAHAIQQRVGSGNFICGDVTNSHDVASVFEMITNYYEGRLDILINNAGAGAGPYARGLFPDESNHTWQRVLGVNLTGTFTMCRAAWPFLVKNGGGAIVNMSSFAAISAVSDMALGFRESIPCVAYAAAKAGIEALTRSIAARGAQHHIRVNCLRPGQILTHGDAHPSARHYDLLQCIPGPGTPEDVAKAALFLASDDARFITGTILDVDGGAAGKLA